MAKELLWNEDMKCVYGWANDFQSEDEFKAAVESEYDLGTCKFNSVDRKLCISTEKGIAPETIQPVELTDIEMEWFYIAMVEPFDLNEDDEAQQERPVKKS